MKIVLYIVNGMFVVVGLGVLSSYAASRRIGELLAGIIFLASATASASLLSWWPLLIGFVALWFLRFVGLDPGAGR